jgi:hypothetical protein
MVTLGLYGLQSGELRVQGTKKSMKGARDYRKNGFKTARWCGDRMPFTRATSVLVCCLASGVVSPEPP